MESGFFGCGDALLVFLLATTEFHLENADLDKVLDLRIKMVPLRGEGKSTARESTDRAS